MHARNSLKLRYFEGGLSKSLKKGSFIFSFKKVNGQDYDEQKRPGTSAVMIFGETDFNRGFGGLWCLFMDLGQSPGGDQATKLPEASRI